jgi:uncharacterized coiled-coil protein SlyX
MRNRNTILIAILSAIAVLLPGVQALAGEEPAAPQAPRAPQQASTAPDIPANVNPSVMQLPATPDPGAVGGSFNTADGTNALGSVTTGAANSAFGWFSLFSNTDGSFNTAVGAGTLLFNVGDQAGGLGLENTAVGTAALLFNTTGSNSTAVGTAALLNNIDGSGTAIGRNALRENTSGSANTATGFNAMIANTTGFNNAAYGVRPMESNVDGVNNTAIGNLALSNNVSGSDNVALGRLAGSTPPLTGEYNNTILLGILGDADALDPDGRCYIGNIRGVTVANGDGINVIVDSTGQLGTSNSSRRFKKDIKPMDQTSEAILALKPVTFHYKDLDTKKAENTPQFGLIAEDVAEVNPDLVVLDAEGKPLTVRYEAVNAMLLNEFLKEHKKVEAQQATIAELKSTVAQQQKGIEVLTAQLKEQGAQIQKVSAQLEVSKPVTKVVLHNP